MLLNRPILLILASALSYWLSGQELSDYYPNVSGELVEHTYYALDYNEAHEQANWVIYFAGNTGNVERTDHFRSDPEVDTRSAGLTDYRGSGYDRGHLAPAADMSSSSVAMSESFYLSNMSPQDAGFNRGIWKSLEALVRNWSVEANSQVDVIVTGPVLSGSICGTIGNGVSVPCSYFKIYADLATNAAIAFVMPNESSKMPLRSFAVTIDEVEALTGVDFFPGLEDGLEDRLEGVIDPGAWDWQSTGYYSQSSSSGSSSNATARQCLGIAKSTGVQCRINTKSENGYCHHHQSQASGSKTSPKTGSSTGRCQATTQAGNQCKRTVKSGRYCWQHE